MKLYIVKAEISQNNHGKTYDYYSNVGPHMILQKLTLKGQHLGESSSTPQALLSKTLISYLRQSNFSFEVYTEHSPVINSRFLR